MTRVEEAGALVRELGNAALAIGLYPSEHPQSRLAFEQIERTLREALQERAEISILFMDGKVVLDGEPLHGGEALARSLARVMQARKKDRIVIRRGATAGELQEFLRTLTAPATPTRWAGTYHVRLESLRAGVLASGFTLHGKASGDGDEGFLSTEVHALRALWDGVANQRQLDEPTLGEIMTTLCRTVQENLGAMVPLAPLKSHDEYTFTHILNVGLLAMALAEKLGMPPRAINEVGTAALLHDVGKSLVPLEILNKPGKLTEEEFARIRRHPADGARILLRTTGVPEVAVSVAYEHHIRYDGSGYPHLPPGWRTSLASGITHLVDFYDALRTHRPYRPGMPGGQIVRIMRDESGRQFDPDLLKPLLEIVQQAEGSAP